MRGAVQGIAVQEHYPFEAYLMHIGAEQASTQGLVRELQRRGESQGAAVLCPVPHVTGGLTEPPVVPRFLASLEVCFASPTPLHCP